MTRRPPQTPWIHPVALWRSKPQPRETIWMAEQRWTPKWRVEVLAAAQASSGMPVAPPSESWPDSAPTCASHHTRSSPTVGDSGSAPAQAETGQAHGLAGSAATSVDGLTRGGESRGRGQPGHACPVSKKRRRCSMARRQQITGSCQIATPATGLALCSRRGVTRAFLPRAGAERHLRHSTDAAQAS
jgi:hypothetical protein